MQLRQRFCRWCFRAKRTQRHRRLYRVALQREDHRREFAGLNGHKKGHKTVPFWVLDGFAEIRASAGGDDGTRTRGLCRGRAATTSKSLKSNGVGRHSLVRQDTLRHCYRPLNVPRSHSAQSPAATASQQYGFPRCHRRNFNPFWMTPGTVPRSHRSRSRLLVPPLRSTTTWCKHWPQVPRELCSRTCQLRLDSSVWHSHDSGCLKD
jgi:hypothetical protein